MLQLTVWTALAEQGIGASLQHYNPLIDVAVTRVFSVQESWRLAAQMPFGVALDTLPQKTREPLSKRFVVKHQPVVA